MREGVLNTIRLHKLCCGHVARMARVDRSTVWNYINREWCIDEWTRDAIEEAVTNWSNELYQKRKKLLENTQYAHIYSNVD